MNLLRRLIGDGESGRMSIDEYAAALTEFTYGGLGYSFGASYGIQQTLNGVRTEAAPNHFVGLAGQAYAANGVVFACMLVRQLVFSSVRFRWQRLRDGRPSDMFGTKHLRLLERPWTGGTTQDLLSRMIQDADLVGNSYHVIEDGELVRLRPDWVEIIVEERLVRGGRGELGGGQIGWRKAGYRYTEMGPGSGAKPVVYLPHQVAHFAPIPDPLASYRGMSWLTPILREIQADHAMTTHQRRFFDNSATPNMVIKHFPGAPGISGATQDGVRKWVEEFESKHAGARNAGKTLQLYPGADVSVVGTNLKDVDFSSVLAGGEVRIAAAAGVPPVIVGLSKGLDSSTYSNYSQARRRLADGTAHPLWQNMAGCIGNIMPDLGDDVRLWYDADDVPFLREDEKDAAEIAKVRAETINTLITAGYEPDSVVTAVQARDLRLLSHTGLTSVQLSPPGSAGDSDGGSDDDGDE